MFCPKCGNNLAEGKFCGKCGATASAQPVTQSAPPVQPAQQPNITQPQQTPQPQYAATPAAAKTKSKKIWIIIVVIIAVAAIAATAVVDPFDWLGEPTEQRDNVRVRNERGNRDNETRQERLEPRDRDTNGDESPVENGDEPIDEEPTMPGRVTPVNDIEAEMAVIRQLHAETQSVLPSLRVEQVGQARRYYDDNGNLRRIFVSGDRGSELYYFNNDSLYFAFIFQGSYENRFYFLDGTMFRWIDNARNTFDNDFGNPLYMEWKSYILGRVNNLF